MSEIKVGASDEMQKALEKLAASMGKKVEDLHPFYMKQAVITGIVNLAMIVISVVIFAILASKGIDYLTVEANRGTNQAFFVGMVTIFLCGGVICSMFCSEWSKWIGNILNPTFRATQYLTCNITSILHGDDK
ncbi:MAG: hypothetical protein KAS32_01780 [Candidatus Peribacteraceae bacterium]|nr:hypothetical protein [Candidatus Peribacteraceae bacterium]